MKKIDLYSMPYIEFAHEHKAECYDGGFLPTQGGLEITYIAEGQLIIAQNDELFTAEKGDVICFLYDTPISLGTDKFHCHHTVGISVQWNFTDTPNGLCMPAIIRAADGTEELIGMIDECIYKPYLTEGSPAKNAANAINILCKIDQICRKMGDFRQSEGSVLAAKAVKYIHHNIHKPLTQAEVAKHLGVSTGYLCSVFKRAQGMTFIRYVNTVKLKGIQSMMEKENMRLYEAAELFGYSDPNYVSALYKRLFGRSITDKPNHPIHL